MSAAARCASHCQRFACARPPSGVVLLLSQDYTLLPGPVAARWEDGNGGEARIRQHSAFAGEARRTALYLRPALCG